MTDPLPSQLLRPSEAVQRLERALVAAVPDTPLTCTDITPTSVTLTGPHGEKLTIFEDHYLIIGGPDYDMFLNEVTDLEGMVMWLREEQPSVTTITIIDHGWLVWAGTVTNDDPILDELDKAMHDPKRVESFDEDYDSFNLAFHPTFTPMDMVPPDRHGATGPFNVVNDAGEVLNSTPFDNLLEVADFLDGINYHDDLNLGLPTLVIHADHELPPPSIGEFDLDFDFAAHNPFAFEDLCQEVSTCRNFTNFDPTLSRAQRGTH